MERIKNPNAAGIDISSREHVVAVPKYQTEHSVRTFGTFTEDLHRLAKWLTSCNVKTIAMESTGVYWYHLYTVLLDYGFEVYLVNAYYVKNVPGRKSDISDAQWLQELHSFGLLKACFQPDNLTRTLRNYVRLRKSIIEQMGSEVQRMQKALEQMNIKLNNVIRELTGKTGMAIIEAILSGERSPVALAKNRDYRIKASEQVIVKSLTGNWREEQIFNLQMAYEHYCFLQNQLKKCDKESEKTIKKMSGSSTKQKEIKEKKKAKNSLNFNASQYLYNALGVDITQIFGVKETTGLTIVSETGINLKETFPSEKQFLNWLNVVPDNKITGGKVISSRVRKKKNKAGFAFRDAANALWRAQNPLGDYLRRKKARSGSKQAIVSTARKIAAIYYKMVTEKVEFDPQYLKQKTKQYLEQKLIDLEINTIRIKKLLANEMEFNDAVI